nr:Protease inhibitor I8 domain containing protein [Haemonchus contortus]
MLRLLLIIAYASLGFSQMNCGPNEVFDTCGSACEPSCRNPNPTICTLQCVVGCRCRQGFFRDDFGQCVASCGPPGLPMQSAPSPWAAPPQPGPSPSLQADVREQCSVEEPTFQQSRSFTACSNRSYFTSFWTVTTVQTITSAQSSITVSTVTSACICTSAQTNTGSKTSTYPSTITDACTCTSAQTDAGDQASITASTVTDFCTSTTVQAIASAQTSIIASAFCTITARTFTTTQMSTK